MTFMINQNVVIDLGYKVIPGVVVKYDGGKYIGVKHDNFDMEFFNIDVVSDDMVYMEDILNSSILD